MHVNVKSKGEMMREYNGHRSWNAWNVSLWLSNDEGLYRWVTRLVREYGKERAALKVFREIGGERTPDGAVYNRTCIRAALTGWE